jgi:hypothetical protein
VLGNSVEAGGRLAPQRLRRERHLGLFRSMEYFSTVFELYFRKAELKMRVLFVGLEGMLGVARVVCCARVIGGRMETKQNKRRHPSHHCTDLARLIRTPQPRHETRDSWPADLVAAFVLSIRRYAVS